MSGTRQATSLSTRTPGEVTSTQVPRSLPHVAASRAKACSPARRGFRHTTRIPATPPIANIRSGRNSGRPCSRPRRRLAVRSGQRAIRVHAWSDGCRTLRGTSVLARPLRAGTAGPLSAGPRTPSQSCWAAGVHSRWCGAAPATTALRSRYFGRSRRRADGPHMVRHHRRCVGNAGPAVALVVHGEDVDAKPSTPEARCGYGRRAFRRVAGLAYAAGELYGHRSRSWWLDVTVDQTASAALRHRPLRHSAVGLHDEPRRYGSDDPVAAASERRRPRYARQHLASLPKR